MDLGAEVTSVISGISGVVGFIMLFTPVTILPGIILLGISGGLGGAGGIIGGGVAIKRRIKHKSTKSQLDILFGTAGFDPKSFDDLVKVVLKTGNELSEKYKISMNKALEYVQIFIIKIWSAINVINRRTIIIKAFPENLKQLGADVKVAFGSSEHVVAGVAEPTVAALRLTTTALKSAQMGVSLRTFQSVARIVDGADSVSSSGIAAAKTFVNFSKGAQALQAIGLAFSIVTIGAGVYGAVQNVKQIKGGCKDVLAEKLRMYVDVINNFMLVRQSSEDL